MPPRAVDRPAIVQKKAQESGRDAVLGVTNHIRMCHTIRHTKVAGLRTESTNPQILVSGPRAGESDETDLATRIAARCLSLT